MPVTIKGRGCVNQLITTKKFVVALAVYQPVGRCTYRWFSNHTPQNSSHRID